MLKLSRKIFAVTLAVLVCLVSLPISAAIAVEGYYSAKEKIIHSAPYYAHRREELEPASRYYLKERELDKNVRLAKPMGDRYSQSPSGSSLGQDRSKGFFGSKYYERRASEEQLAPNKAPRGNF